MELRFMKINIIDPSSTEFNRGSFCYAPYLLYNGLKEAGNEVVLTETFISEDLDKIASADAYVICLWSYPQFEAALLLAQMIPFSTGNKQVYYVGYKHFAESLGLPYVDSLLGFDPLQDKTFLRSAMQAYPRYYKDFKRLLLSDCDMHLQSLEKGEKVYPLFTTYGCPNGCAFCPSTENCGLTRVQLSVEETVSLLERCYSIGVKSIHFTDEDFFFNIDRAASILQQVAHLDFHFIALGSSRKVKRFVDKYGIDFIKSTGLEVVEVGFETAAEDLSHDMGFGKSVDFCRQLAEIQHTLPFKIFWLVQTFFPGETIKSLNETGLFMQQFGFSKDEVVGRLRTNGTTGGLGQFFQPYVGLKIYKDLDGIFLTERPIRLVPSYIPQSFLDSKITGISRKTELLDAAFIWSDIYNVSTEMRELLFQKIQVGDTISKHLAGLPVFETTKKAISLAILSRFSIII